MTTYSFYLLSWENNYYVLDGVPKMRDILEVENFVTAIADLESDDTLDLRIVYLSATDKDNLEMAELLEIISESLPDMLKDGVISVDKCQEFTLHGIDSENANKYLGVKKYMLAHPFI